MKNISKEDFILWDTVNDINTDGFKLLKGQELRCVAELSKGWQIIISEAIEQTK
jgi:hypothetical protein